SDRRVAGDDAILRHDDNTVTDVIAGTIEVVDSFLVQYPHVFSDVRVLIDDGVADDGPAADSDIRYQPSSVVREVFFAFVIVRAHHHDSVQFRVFSDLTANTDNRVIDLHAIQY